VTNAATGRDIEARAEALASEIERLAERGQIADELAVTTVQHLLAAATRAYVAHLEAGAGVPPFSTTAGVRPVTATEAVAAASEMLRALDLEVFELAMWQSQGGIRAAHPGDQR
jgi:hypothetical protein